MKVLYWENLRMEYATINSEDNMSKILDTANGDCRLSMEYDLEVYHLFDSDSPNQEEKAQIDAFVKEHGEGFCVEVFAVIDEGWAEFSGCGDIVSNKSKKTLSEDEIPQIILEDIISSASSHAEEYGLEHFLSDW